MRENGRAHRKRYGCAFMAMRLEEHLLRCNTAHLSRVVTALRAQFIMDRTIASVTDLFAEIRGRRIVATTMEATGRIGKGHLVTFNSFLLCESLILKFCLQNFGYKIL